jgi:hypothetical protein
MAESAPFQKNFTLAISTCPSMEFADRSMISHIAHKAGVLNSQSHRELWEIKWSHF